MNTIYKLVNVTQRYGKRDVLHIEQMTIQRGEILALVGPSGAGKSTFLRLLAMSEAPTYGNVLLHLTGYEPKDYHTISTNARRELAMVFQRPVLMSRSVRENVAYGLKIRGKRNYNAIVTDALKQVGLTQLADARPNTLSGGEMQRVSIARAMILRPQVLLLDEPTANLDPQNIRIIERGLQAQHERYNTTIIIVTHNIFQAKRLADRVGLIYDGELVEVAQTEQFFENPLDERTAAFTSGALVY